MSRSLQPKSRNRIQSANKCDVEARLQMELERLKRILNAGYELEVEWRPNWSNNLEGEVKESTIYVYSKEIEKAIEALTHEFLDYAISQLIEPYKDVANAFIAMKNKEVYKRKEKLVNRISKFLQ